MSASWLWTSSCCPRIRSDKGSRWLRCSRQLCSSLCLVQAMMSYAHISSLRERQISYPLRQRAWQSANHRRNLFLCDTLHDFVVFFNCYLSYDRKFGETFSCVSFSTLIEKRWFFWRGSCFTSWSQDEKSEKYLTCSCYICRVDDRLQSLHGAKKWLRQCETERAKKKNNLVNEKSPDLRSKFSAGRSKVENESRPSLKWPNYRQSVQQKWLSR